MANSPLGVGDMQALFSDRTATTKERAKQMCEAGVIPKCTTTIRDAIVSPQAGYLIFNTTTSKLNVRGANAWEVVTSA